jgi:hypothetical protein
MISQRWTRLLRSMTVVAAMPILALAGCADLPSTPAELQAAARDSAELQSTAHAVLASVEAHLLADPDPGPAVDRALRLTRLARHELDAGDPARALRRAVYALQLLRGHGLQFDESGSAVYCANADC